MFWKINKRAEGGLGTYVMCVLCFGWLVMRCLFADKVPVSMRQPETTSYSMGYLVVKGLYGG